MLAPAGAAGGGRCWGADLGGLLGQHGLLRQVGLLRTAGLAWWKWHRGSAWGGPHVNGSGPQILSGGSRTATCAAWGLATTAVGHLATVAGAVVAIAVVTLVVVLAAAVLGWLGAAPGASAPAVVGWLLGGVAWLAEGR